MVIPAKYAVRASAKTRARKLKHTSVMVKMRTVPCVHRMEAVHSLSKECTSTMPHIAALEVVKETVNASSLTFSVIWSFRALSLV
jgi:hypothetical protein